MKKVKLTVEIDSELNQRAKVIAARKGYTVTGIVRGLLESYVKREEQRV